MKRFVLYLCVSFFVAISQANAQDILINEFMSSNANTVLDEDGDSGDWIELYNASDNSVNLAGYGLSDKEENPFKWIFPEVEVPSKSWLLVWASGKDRRNPDFPLHTNFSISADGEPLILSRPSGVVVDQVAGVQLSTDLSYGRQPDGAASCFVFTNATPGLPNTTTGYLGIAPDPVFSHISGFYQNAFSLNLSSPVEGASVYYTLDGSEPDEGSFLYYGSVTVTDMAGVPNDISMIPTNEEPLGAPYYEGWQVPLGEVKKACIVRAKVVAENYLPGKTITHSYLVDPLGSTRYTLPVIFLNTDRRNFFDPEIGIYIPGNHQNMYQEGNEWERPVHFEMFEKNGVPAFSLNMGVRLHGGATRNRPRKTIRCIASDEYEIEPIAYKLFPEKNVFYYSSFLLRNSGNDWDQSLFRDGLMHYLARGLNIESQYYRPSIVFLNGEYWGIHNIRDRYDADYFLYHYGFDEDEIVAMENNSAYDYGNLSGTQHYNNLRQFIDDNSLSFPENYNHVKSMMDVESFTDAWIASIYVRNTDWPNNNLVYWRRMINYNPSLSPGYDGRWRWALLDTDYGFGLNYFYVPGADQGAAHNTLAMAAEANSSTSPNPAWSTMIFRKLLGNNDFKIDFINRFADLLNTTFNEENVVHVVDSIEQALRPEMQEHINRWRRPESINQWESNTDVLRQFALQRPGYIRQHIIDQFSLSGTINVKLSVSDPKAGKVSINSIVPLQGAEWTGIYFQGVPITLEAIPEVGYAFSHWSGDNSSQNSLIKPVLSSNASFKAHFYKLSEFQGDKLNPKAYPLVEGDYVFNAWDENQPEGSFPPNMLFLQSDTADPRLDYEMVAPYVIPESEYSPDDLPNFGFPYKLSGRTRMNGLGEDGISFINTGRQRDLGAAVLAIDTRGMKDIRVSWTGGILTLNSKVYAIRLQVKIGPYGHFTDVLDPNGKAVEYLKNPDHEDQETFGPVALAYGVNNQPYIQLRWKYYYTGERRSEEENKRDMLRLDDIVVTGNPIDTMLIQDESDKPVLFQNYPNPASDVARIMFVLPYSSDIQIDLFDINGQNIGVVAKGNYLAGYHTITLDLKDFAPGMYFYRFVSGDFSQSKRMMLIGDKK